MQNRLNKDSTMKSTLACVAVAINRMHAAVTKDNHFIVPTRPRQYSEESHIATQAPVQ